MLEMEVSYSQKLSIGSYVDILEVDKGIPAEPSWRDNIRSSIWSKEWWMPPGESLLVSCAVTARYLRDLTGKLPIYAQRNPDMLYIIGVIDDYFDCQIENHNL